MSLTSFRQALMIAPVGLLLGPTAFASAAENCADGAGRPPPANVTDLPELGPSLKHPTLTVPSGDSGTASGGVTLLVRGEERIGQAKGEATAALIDKPSLKGRELAADLSLAATPIPTGSGVSVRACVSRKNRWEAGTYEGTLHVYGPALQEFSYALVVLSKWPAEVPLAILAAVVIGFLIAEVRRTETGKHGDALYFAVAAGGALLTYFSQYWTSPTWGDDPYIQVSGLVSAAVAAAAAGRAGAKKAFGS